MQIFPKQYDYDTHEVINSSKGCYILPETRDAINNPAESFSILRGTGLRILEENVGAGNKFHKLICLNKKYSDLEFFNREIWVESSNLKSLNLNKKKSIFSTDVLDNPSKNSPVIDWTTKEPFIPFSDSRTGKYSVVIESDFEAIASVEHLNIISKNAFYAGVDILLQSKGKLSGKAEIDRLLSEYWTFASVDEYYVDTRKCVPIKLLVSIPLRFLNGKNVVIDERPQQQKAAYFIKFKSSEIVQKIDGLIAGFLKYEEEINDFLTPNGVITAFSLSYEIFNIKTFLKSFIRILNEGGYAFNESIGAEYEIGINEDYKIVSVRFTDGTNFFEIPYSTIVVFSNIEPLNSKRTINYFLKIDQILRDFNNLKFKEFAEKNITFPKPEFIKKDITITIPEFNGLGIPPEVTSADISEAIKNSNKAKYISATMKGAMDIISNYREFDSIVKSEKQRDKLVSSPDVSKDAKEKTFGQSVSQNLGQQFGYDEKLSATKNTLKILADVAIKLRLAQSAIKALTCTLKKIDPNDPEYQQFVEQIGPELNQWLGYLFTLAQTDAAKFKEEDVEAMAINTGLAATPVALKFLPEDYLEAIYKLVNSAAAVFAVVQGFRSAKAGIKLVPTFKINKPKTPSSLMAQIVNAVVNTGLQILFKKLSEEIIDLVQKQLCVDESNPADYPGLNDLFKNPLDSTNIGDSNSKSPENERQNIKRDREESLRDAGILSAEQDGEAIVDLLKLLLDDISCVLTPREICGLLSDNVDENVVLIIKSIIKRKYLPEMRDLLEEQKLRLLFKEIGKRIDTTICDQINEIADSNPTAPSIQCSPQQLKLREELLNNKLPKELVNGQLTNYSKRKLAEAQDLARKIGDNFTFEFDKPLLCGSGEEGIISPLDDVSIDMARRRLDSLLSPAYSTFNSDAAEWKNAYVKQDKIEIKDEDGNHVFTKDVNIINKPLYLNLADDSSSTISSTQDGFVYNFIVKNKFIGPEALEQIKALPETEGVNKELLVQEITTLLNTPLWNINIIDNNSSRYSVNIRRLEEDYLTLQIDKKNNISNLLEKFDNIVLNAKQEVKDSFGFDDEPRDPRAFLNEINEYVFDNLKSSILNLKMFSKTAPYKVFKNEDNVIKTDLIEAAFGLAQEDDDFVLTSYVDGTPFIKDFSLEKIPTLEQQLCGVDPHYLGIKKLKGEALQDFKDNFCNNVGDGDDDGTRPLNEFEKASLYICLKLMFRVYVTDYLSKILPIFSAYPLQSLVENNTYITLLEKLIREDMTIFGEKFNKDFEKYTEEYFQKLIKEGKIEPEFYSISRFDTVASNIPDISSYQYMIKKELKYCAKRINKELIDKKLIENREELQNILATNFLKAYDYVEPDADLEDRPTEKIYLEEYIRNLPEENAFFDESLIPYAELFDFFEGNNDDGLILGGLRLVYQDGENKVILFSKEVPTGRTKEEVMELDDGPKTEYLNSLKQEVRNQFFNTDEYKTFANLLPAEDMLSFLSIYSTFCCLDNQELFNSYLTTKQKIYSAIITLIGDKSYRNEGYDGNNNRDTTMALLRKLANSPFPMEELKRNPSLLGAGAMEMIKALLKIPIDIIRLEAEGSDPNISVAAKISTVSQIPLSLLWSFTPAEKRQELIKSAPVIFKRLRDNVRVLPVFLPSFGLMAAFLFPFPAGIAYLGINIAEEVLYNIRILSEVDEEVGSVGSAAKPPFSPSTVAQTIKCNPELQKKLQSEVDMED